MQLSNQQFCYWLQGYFEISKEPLIFGKRQIQIIAQRLNKISEPLGELTGWLKQVCEYCADLEYRQETIDHFLPLIKTALNNIFLHVIDNSYDTQLSSEQLKKIHDGVCL